MNTRQKLRHIRVIDGNIISGRGGATVSAIVKEDGTVVKWAVAYCHPKDNFNRHLGRVKATGRMNSKTQSFTPVTNVTYDDVVNCVFEEVQSNYMPYLTSCKM